MGLVKTRRLVAMHKQECAKAGLKSRQLKVTPLLQLFEYLKERKLHAPTSLPSNSGMEISPS